jgi:DNA ligase 4
MDILHSSNGAMLKVVDDNNTKNGDTTHSRTNRKGEKKKSMSIILHI